MTRALSNSRDRRRALLVTAVVTLLLLLPVPLSLADLGRGELFEIGKDKIAHFLLFVPLAWVWLEAAKFRGALGERSLGAVVSARDSALVAALVATLVLWGGAIELVQSWTGWRRGEWSDLAADALGVLVGLAGHGWRLRAVDSTPTGS